VSASECVEQAIAGIEAVNPKLNAVIHKMYEKARAQAKGALPDGPFRGVPFVVKGLDGFLANEPFTQSCRLSKDFVPDHDAEIIARMKRTGLVIVGKTNTPELGILGVTEPELRGPTRNPWNLDHTTGGSSGGTGAMVSSRALPFGHGGDGGGSIRIPSSACGLFGLKPSRGRNPLGPDIGEGWGGYVQQGVITRSVRDCAAMLDATSGPDAGAPYTAPAKARAYLDELNSKPRKLKIAFATSSRYGKDVHPDCAAAVKDAAELCRSLGHEVFEGEPSIDKRALTAAYFTQVAVSVALGIEQTARWVNRVPTSADFEPTTWLLGQIGRKLGAVDLQRGRDACMVAARVVGKFFGSCDLFLDATLAYPPARVGELGLKPAEKVLLGVLRAFSPKAVLDKVLADLGANALEKTPNTQLANQIGTPAMSVPLTFGALPIGVQLMAPYGDEATLFQLAAQLEQARPWAAKKPPVCATV
ncbi:MAG TPA: amidase, partial [Myxococcota bacterium]